MSAVGWRVGTHCQEHTDVPAAWERHVHRASQCGLQIARTWIKSTALFGVTFNRRFITVDDSRQSTSWSRQSSLIGTNYCSVSLIAPLVSGVAGLSKANKLNIWCKNCSMWVTLDNNWDNKHVVPCKRARKLSKYASYSSTEGAPVRLLATRMTLEHNENILGHCLDLKLSSMNMQWLAVVLR